MWMTTDLTPPRRPAAYASMTLLYLDGDVVGGISRLMIDAEWTRTAWSWFVIVGGDFRAGRADTREKAITLAKMSATSLKGGAHGDQDNARA